MMTIDTDQGRTDELYAQRAVAKAVALEEPTKKAPFEITLQQYIDSIRELKMRTWPPHRPKPTTKHFSSSFKRREKAMKRKFDTKLFAHKLRAACKQRQVDQAHAEQFLRAHNITWRMVEKASHEKGKEAFEVAVELIGLLTEQGV